ncbi:MAG: CoA-binding protein [Gammaproteobacteria bacterium]|nr:CoA-binding protein [Gammaproteobacteria bacterium]
MTAIVDFQNPPDEEIRELLLRVGSIAVVGLSPRNNRPSHGVAAQMQRFGYRIIPVRPAVDNVLGEKAYALLRAVPDRYDLVDVFRNPKYVDSIVDECIALRAPAIWLQEGVINVPAARRARAAGLLVVMDRCVYREYIRLFGPVPRPG